MNHHDMTNIGVARASINALKDEVAGLNQYRKALEAKHDVLEVKLWAAFNRAEKAEASHTALVAAVEELKNNVQEIELGDSDGETLIYYACPIDFIDDLIALAAANESHAAEEQADE